MPIIVPDPDNEMKVLVYNEDGTLAARGLLAVSYLPEGPGPHIVNGIQLITDPGVVAESEREALMRSTIQVA